MTKYDTALLGCRLLAIYCLFLSINSISMAVTGLGFFAEPSFISFVVSLAYCLPFLLTLAFSLALWTQAAKVAEYIFPASDDSLVTTAIDAETVRVVAFSIMGVFLLVNAVPLAVQMLGNQILLARQFETANNLRLTASTFAKLLSFVIEGALGVWLILGAKRISAWIVRLQNKPDVPSDDDLRRQESPLE